MACAECAAPHRRSDAVPQDERAGGIVMMPDWGIRESVWPTNGSRPTVFVPWDRREFGPIKEEQIQPASLDVRLGPEIVTHPRGERILLSETQSYTLRPGKCVLASLVERLDMWADNVAARIEGK